MDLDTSSDHAQGVKIKQTRASQACQRCRVRKIKCDVTSSGPPCHNCKIDHINCLTTENRRSRKVRVLKRVDDVGTPILELADFQQHQEATTLKMKDGGLLSNFRIQTPKRPRSSSRDSISQVAATSTHGSWNASSTPGQPPDPPPLWEPGRVSLTTGVAAIDILPAYILPPQREIPEAELQFLISQGALSIPDDELRNQLLRDFIWYSYPYMPVICLEDFLQALEGDGQHRISLILFHAVMFAGSSFVDELYLHQAGFEDRRSARAFFYKKVKLLYDFDWESDRITLMQTIMLHTYWYTTESDQKDPWHWAGICMSLGMTLGLSDKVTYMHEDSKTKKLWRRLWWCCYLRDRALAISARRPMRFRDDQVRISMLHIDDFDLHAPPTRIATVKHAFAVMTYDCRVALAHLCMENIKLSSILGQIMSKLYGLQAFSGTTKGPRMLYSPRTSEFAPRDVNALENELERWTNLLPSKCRVGQDAQSRSPTAELLYMHQATLKLGYLLVTEALYRPLSISRRETTLSTDVLQRRSRPIVKECAVRTAEMVQSLRERDLFRFLPPGAGTCIGVAVASFLAEIKMSGKSMSEIPHQHFQQCIRGLWSLRETWPIADAVCRIVGHMMRAQDVENARVIALQAPPLPMEDGVEETNEPKNVEPRMDADIESLIGPPIQVQDLESGILPGDSIDLDLEAAAQASVSDRSAFGLLDDDEVWSLSNQFPWTLTEFGLYGDFDQGDKDTLLPSGTSRGLESTNHDVNTHDEVVTSGSFDGFY